MAEIDRALADIVAIRTQIARQHAFRGYGPTAMALTGLLAAATATIQAVALPDHGDLWYFAPWIATAIAAVGIAGAEVVTRSRRLHSRLADAMIVAAVEDFAPAGAAGALLLVVLARFEPHALWMLPGLWQILVSLGLFAASRSLPRSVGLVAAWYLVAGLVVLMLASASHRLGAAMMGVPFTGGQLLFALVLHRSLGGDRDDA